jgi:hypothetical protein
MSILSLDQNKVFYNLPDVTQKDVTKTSMNSEDVYNKTIKEEKYANGNIFTIYEAYIIYKKKYNYFYEQNDLTKHLVFNKKFKVPVHRLTMSIDHLESIKSLPKDLLSLYIEGSVTDSLNFPVSVIPKKIVSIFITSFPFNGVDLSKLKNLKAIGSTNEIMVKFPKLPKSIEYISFKNSGLAFNFPDSLNRFKLSDFPKLKYFDLSGVGIKRKDIPQEWKDAKKSKKIYIKY